MSIMLWRAKKRTIKGFLNTVMYIQCRVVIISRRKRYFISFAPNLRSKMRNLWGKKVIAKIRVTEGFKVSTLEEITEDKRR